MSSTTLHTRTAEEAALIREVISKEFSTNIVPSIMDYIRIPNISPLYDTAWLTNGLLLKAAQHIEAWVQSQSVEGLNVEIVIDEGKPPLVFIEIAPTDDTGKTILFYGHYDKQPHFTGWMEGTGPTSPAIIDGKLYGRGGSDDGYSVYAAVSSVKACQTLGFKHPRCVITIEGEEESGSTHYMKYIERLTERIRTPDFIFCLDSGCGTYDSMWLTTSLRGNIKAEITVKVLNEGVHSGDASGIVPSSFRVLRNILDRIEDSSNGQCHQVFQANIPSKRYSQACEVAEDLGKDIYLKFPYAEKTESMSLDPLQAYLNKTWRAQLAVVGAMGIPHCSTAGNVLLPDTTIRISLRLPPTLDAIQAAADLKRIIEENPPHNAVVQCKILSAARGWDVKEQPEFLSASCDAASMNYYGTTSRSLCEGGSIPLMNELQNKFPNIQFIVTGVLGPHSNAHGPNEMLHLDFTEKLICCMTQIVADTSAFFSK